MKNKKNILIILIILLISGSLIYYFKSNYEDNNKKIKYVFLFIGDGMNLNHVELTEIYNNIIKNDELENQKKLSFDKFTSIGIRKNHDKYNYVPDSASSGTAIASGLITSNGMLNIDDDGRKKDPITYALKKKRKMKVGIITTVPITHATPAAFYAYNFSRKNYYDIANDLVKSNFDYFGDGGFELYGNQLKEIENKLKNKNYKIVSTKQQIDELNKNSGKVIAINPNQINGTTKYMIDAANDDLNLKDFVKKGIDVLDNKNGFFIMAESGMIDFASHNDDAKGVISEVNVLDAAVKEALKFYNNHPDETLIIVTGDHETGGLALGNNKEFGLDLLKLKYQNYSLSVLQYYLRNTTDNFDNVLNYLDLNYGISTDKSKFFLSEENKIKLKNYYNKKDVDEFINVIRDIIYTETKIGWTSFNHTASPVIVYAKGNGSDIFNGKYTTVEFNKKLRKILGVN